MLQDRSIHGERKERFKQSVAQLDEALNGRHNYLSFYPHSTRHGLQAYEFYFSGRYLFDRTAEAIRDHGLYVAGVSRNPGEFIEKATLKVKVRPVNRELSFPLDRQ